MLGAVRYGALGVHQKTARQTDNSFIRSASGSRWQFFNCRRRHVYADDGKIAVFKFPNVGTAGAAGAFRSVGVRVVTDSAEKSDVFHKLNLVAFNRYGIY